MNDPITNFSPPEPPAAPAGLTFGAQLAAARTHAGLTVNEVAGRLRLHPKQVAAIENEQLDQLPAGPFVRGFLRNYAKELRLAPEPLIELLNAKLAPPAPVVEQSQEGAVDLAASSAAQTTRHEKWSRNLALAGTLCLLVLLAAVGWLERGNVDREAQRKKSEAANTIAAAEPSPAQASPPLPANQASPATQTPPPGPAPVAAGPNQGPNQGLNQGQMQAPVAPQSSSSAQPPASAQGATPEASSPAALAAPTVVQQAPASAPPAPPPSAAAAPSAEPAKPSVPAPLLAHTPTDGTMLRLGFSDRPSWLEVAQADGKVLYAGMSDAGTERRLVGQPPFRVVVGNASTVTLDFRGKRVDLKPYIRGDDVARLTLE